MAEAGPKIRVAIGVFDDAVRLNLAADALLALGLDPESLCLAAHKATKAADAGRCWAATDESAGLVWFRHAKTASDRSYADWRRGFVTLIAEALEEAAAVNARCARSSHGWSTINVRLSEGALLLAALVPSAPMQDQAVRVLLRHSPYPVHAEEFPAVVKPS